MRKLSFLVSITAAFFLASLSAYAADWSADQKAVWTTVGEAWEAEKNKDFDAFGSYLADDFKGWSNNGAMPLDKASEISWVRFGSDQDKTLKYELSPVGLVVHGDTAVAHYYYVLVEEDKEGKRHTRTGRWSDVLVRDGKSWKFIGWQGSRDASND